ncbi:unnamed protein product [Arabidopsis thaliana]|uniref:TATA box-binding protein associated factor RNA polymerase I subunit C n=3 Tax=Arabidopsis TaxID=3701 RepID=Q9LS59_ARATH|nr:TATA box-binding protein associated factor RNA polymerase I subunit C [Arabidopsis thaliana]AEE76081.1 TATA box-binding protein associated factor RNA polymerase I subunit C [Arabidopsis thaliana]KAG7625690.1 hypothetical protein ISN45_At03g019100 [Arabidopsis thaliana x Arabidopsis arenosa]OAP02486.1 hypothetical protein AXX17_AT3G19440 [Arabidopsis thaliana]BAB01097.1 unnamed protein product [Arabidopsis thaliana]|eukprot:NP_188460.1 TATA box-binding protein associated factor RNA polymerase I subunit C [Arabidopsis thaliana]
MITRRRSPSKNPMEMITDEWGRKLCITSSPEESIGPFFSNPSDSQLLFSSPSLSPPILSITPHLTPARFLSVSGVPPSDSSAINSSFKISNPHDDTVRVLSYNRLQFLPFPSKNSVLVFFPTGTNLDQIGFLLLSYGDSGGLQVTGSDEGDVFVATERLFSRILKILVQPVSDFGAYKCSSSSGELGYVLVYSLYSIHWYCVKYDESQGKPVLRNLGCKQFKRFVIVSASWSPHVTGECLLLLDNGEVFVFDLSQRHCRVRGCKLKVSWESQGKSVNKSWLGCEFGWRVGVYIVARSDALFVIVKSTEDCSVRCLLEVESLNTAGAEVFVGFAKAGSDGFRFVLASQSYVFLCDARSGVPLLKWQHDVEKPCFMDVYSLSELGVRTFESNTSCLIIGSFWNAQSQMFCFGPSPSVGKDPSSLYVWELPHNLLLPVGKCLCGDCLFREVMIKESLPEWIDWQKKSVLVLGFGVLNKYLPLGSSDQSSGFTLIRLTSSGKLEAVKFRASRLKHLEVVAHKGSACKSDEVNLLYLPDDEEYKFPRRFNYLELEYLSAHRKGMLAGFLDSKMRTESSDFKKSESFSLICHEELCKKLKICGFGKGRSASSITAVFENINSPTSVFDIALRETWSSLPKEILMLAFSNYSEFADVLVDKKKQSLEFLVVPEFPQLPPFLLRNPSSRSSKWSKKEQPGVEVVGPVVPLPVLITLHEFHNGCLNSEQEFSPEAEFYNRCNQISKATRQIANSGRHETTISLDEDRADEMWLNSDSQEEKKTFIAYRPITKTAESDRLQQEVTTFVSRIRGCKEGDDNAVGRRGLELFDELSPVEMFFENREVNFDKFDMKAMLTDKTFHSQWQDRSSSYQEFLSQYHLKK